MAIVALGMTALQLVQMAAAGASLTKTLMDIHKERHEQGVPCHEPLSPEHSAVVHAAVAEFNCAWGDVSNPVDAAVRAQMS